MKLCPVPHRPWTTLKPQNQASLSPPLSAHRFLLQTAGQNGATRWQTLWRRSGSCIAAIAAVQATPWTAVLQYQADTNPPHSLSPRYPASISLDTTTHFDSSLDSPLDSLVTGLAAGLTAGLIAHLSGGTQRRRARGRLTALVSSSPIVAPRMARKADGNEPMSPSR